MRKTLSNLNRLFWLAVLVILGAGAIGAIVGIFVPVASFKLGVIVGAAIYAVLLFFAARAALKRKKAGKQLAAA